LDIKLFKQVFLIIGISVLCGASFNAIRDGGISWLARPMEKINSTNKIEAAVYLTNDGTTDGQGNINFVLSLIVTQL